MTPRQKIARALTDMATNEGQTDYRRLVDDTWAPHPLTANDERQLEDFHHDMYAHGGDPYGATDAKGKNHWGWKTNSKYQPSFPMNRTHSQALHRDGNPRTGDGLGFPFFDPGMDTMGPGRPAHPPLAGAAPWNKAARADREGRHAMYMADDEAMVDWDQLDAAYSNDDPMSPDDERNHDAYFRRTGGDPLRLRRPR